MPAAERTIGRPLWVAVSVVGQKAEGKTQWIVNPLYVIDAAEVASVEEAADRALRQFAEEWRGYSVVTSTSEAIGQAIPPKNGSQEDAQNMQGRSRRRHVEAGVGQG